MKKMYKYLSLFPIILLGCTLSATAQSVTFSYTGTMQTYSVPAGITTVYVNTLGGDGGIPYLGVGPSLGGRGGLITCQLAVTAGEILNIFVGGVGQTPASPFAGAPGGYNGGGAGSGNGGGGGGSTDIRVGGTAVSNRVIVVGGGGGAGEDCGGTCGAGTEDGGPGGGLTGGDGFMDVAIENAPNNYGGQTYGFSQPTGASGDAFYGVGGIGGGGGGYWGAYAGYDKLYPSLFNGGGGGGGGSSYTDPATVSNVFHARGGNSLGYPSAGQVVICSVPVAGSISGTPICVGGSCVTLTNVGGAPGGTWSSSNPGIATVSAGGVACPVSYGVDTIYYIVSASCGSDTAAYVFNVAQAAAPITVLGADTICQGNTTALSDTSDGGMGTWTSTPALIASVGTSGVVTGSSPGTSIITYTIPGGCYTTNTVTVTAPLTPITGPAAVCVGVDSITLSDATVGGTWTSSSTSVATVDTFTGVVYGQGTGATYINYFYGGCSTSYHVVANDTPYAITGTNSICQGDATSLSEFSISGTWSSTNTTIATVNPAGNVFGVAAGPDTIVYTVPGCPVTQFPMTINPLPLPITGMTSICIGLATVVSDSTAGGVWSSSDTTVATISPTGVITDVSTVLGASATLTYTLPTTACYVTFPVIVNSGPSSIVGADSICQGATTTLSDLMPGGTWSSTVLSIAQIIDTSGVTTGISPGTVNVSYTYPNGCYATKPLTVEPPVPAFVNVTRTPNTDSVCAGTPVTYVASPVNAGIGPKYSWVKFYTLTPLAGDTTTFVDTAIHGDVIIVNLVVGSGVCATHDTVADTITMDVYPNVTPIVTITKLAAPDTITYLGETITFFASIKYGGAGPQYQWYISGAPVPGATNAVYSTDVYGTEAVYCAVTGNARCDSFLRTDTSNVIFVFDQLSTANAPFAHSNLSLFPNPNNGTLTLSGNVPGNNEFSIEVSDMLGQTVYSGKATPQNGMLNQTITLDPALANGSYLLHVSSGTDNQVFHFVVNR